MKEININYQQIDWLENRNSLQGISSKILRDERGKKTLLLKLPEGVIIDTHKHNKTEQHFIIEGEYKSEGKIYGVGTYRLIPAGTNHGPFVAKKELVILVIWDAD